MVVVAILSPLPGFRFAVANMGGKLSTDPPTCDSGWQTVHASRFATDCSDFKSSCFDL